MLRTPTECRRLLEAAGYAWDDQDEAWEHPVTHRTLDGDVSCAMTPEQIVDWLKADDKRPRRFP